MSTIRDAVRQFVLDRVMTDADPIAFTDDTNLRECGILDSFSTLNLASFLEERFGVQLEATDLDSGHLFSLTGIEGLVLSRQGDSSSSVTHSGIHDRAQHDLASTPDHSSPLCPALSTGLYEYFTEAVSRHQNDIAIVEGSSTFTYGELLTHVNIFADALQAAGMQPGNKATLILGNNRWFVISLLAAWKVGVVVIPLNPQLPEAELLTYFVDSRPEILLTSTKKKSLPELLAAKGAMPSHVWLLSPTANDWTYESGVNASQPGTDTVSAHSHTRPDWPALTQYSTGSTGTPKRVTRTHGQLMGEFTSIASVLTLTSTDRVIGVVPFFHSHGLKNAALLPLFKGAALYPLETFFPRDVANLIAREKITVFPGVPFMFQRLAQLPERPDLSSLRLIFSGSAPLPQSTQREFESAYGRRIRRVYGTTETGLISVEREAGILDDLNRAGHPLPGVLVQIVDDHGAPAPAAAEGRVKVTSPFAPSAYDRSDAHSASYFENGSYFPGDIGRILESGELVLLGRDRGFINVGGHKVDAAEVEAALLEIPGISDAVVFGVPDATYGERVKAVIVSFGNVSINDVRAHLMHRLAEFKHPRIIEFRQELPRTPLGKVQRKSLTEEASDG